MKHQCNFERDFIRRDFLRTSLLGAASLAYATLPRGAYAAEDAAVDAPETLVKRLYDSLNAKQRADVCFEWDYVEPREPERVGRGLLRTYVSNNWHITRPVINTDYFTGEQKELVRKIFEGVIAPQWHARVDKQLKDDAGGFGNSQNIAIFGKPGEGKFEFVMTGRHMTLRCDGNSTEHVAMGGPIFYGHQASRTSGLSEKDGHPDNVYWPQALEANKVWEMLDGKQRKLAAADSPEESEVGFRGKGGKFDGIPVAELSADQKEQVQKTLATLIEMYRQSDQDELAACLKSQGGLDACSLAFYTDSDKGGDGVWDVWRLEGPSFVWHYRGDPHVHVWLNVADDASVKLNT